jgi:hypothetical protein
VYGRELGIEGALVSKVVVSGDDVVCHATHSEGPLEDRCNARIGVTLVMNYDACPAQNRLSCGPR